MKANKLSIDGLIAKMRIGVCRFTYIKKDGTSRFAIGTLNQEIIPKTDMPSGEARERNNVVTYYDVEKEAWRSFLRSINDDVIVFEKVA